MSGRGLHAGVPPRPRTRVATPGRPDPRPRFGPWPTGHWRRCARTASAHRPPAVADGWRGARCGTTQRPTSTALVARVAVLLRLSWLLSPSIIAKVPWVGAQGAHPHRQGHAETRPQQVGGLVAPREFAGPMRDVDQGYVRGPA